MTTQPTLGQRLREWREANGLSVEETAQRLDFQPATVACIEAGVGLGPGPSMRRNIERLISPDHSAIVEAATAAIKAGLESGATVVRIVRCETPTSGRVVVIIGDDSEWREEL